MLSASQHELGVTYYSLRVFECEPKRLDHTLNKVNPYKNPSNEEPYPPTMSAEGMRSGLLPPQNSNHFCSSYLINL